MCSVEIGSICNCFLILEDKSAIWMNYQLSDNYRFQRHEADEVIKKHPHQYSNLLDQTDNEYEIDSLHRKEKFTSFKTFNPNIRYFYLFG